jgi:uncharacterized protein
MRKVRASLLAILFASAMLGAVVSCADKEDFEPTPEAAKRFLLLRGYEFNETGFFRAAAASDVIAVRGFITAGMDPNAHDDNGDTILTAAADRGDAPMVDVLLKAGADVNAKGRNGWTSLLLAMTSDRNAAADRLMAESNIDLKAESPEEMTALMIAVWHQRVDTVRTLIKRGSELNHQDHDGDVAVHGAAWLENLQILGMLLDAGANPNVKNKLGGTALMWAASYGKDKAVQMLLDKGADLRLKDNDGVTAAGWAAKNGRGNTVMLLRQAEKGK